MDIEQRTVGSVMILTIDGDILVNGKGRRRWQTKCAANFSRGIRSCNQAADSV